MDKSSETAALGELVSKYSPYLIEIKKRILVTLIIFAAASVVGFIFYERIIKFVIELLSLEGINIVFTTPFQFINLAISCGIAIGLVVTFPLIIYQLLVFLRPALQVSEFKLIFRFLPFSIVLFLAGFSFGVYIMKWQIQLFLSKSIELGIGNILDISNFISTVLIISVIMGMAFQFPIVLLLLLRLGIISRNQLMAQRSWIYLGAIFFTILLPLDSLLADALLTLPLVLLFELTLLLDRILEKK